MKFKIKDPGSAITHFIGMLMALFAAAPLLLKASADDRLHLAALSIFIISMILLYAASTIYHTLDISPNVNRILKKIDHMMIFILIAGTYTPVCLIVLGDRLGTSGTGMGNRDSRYCHQGLLDLLSQMVLLCTLHRHGLGMRPGIYKDHQCPSAGCIWLASGRRYHLHSGRYHLCTEAVDLQLEA